MALAGNSILYRALLQLRAMIKYVFRLHSTINVYITILILGFGLLLRRLRYYVGLQLN
jgi:hypothetical protein